MKGGEGRYRRVWSTPLFPLHSPYRLTFPHRLLTPLPPCSCSSFATPTPESAIRPQWPDDNLRPLTDKGRKVQRDVSRFLRKRGCAPTVVLTSPWLRAQQTADIMVEVARVPSRPVICESLAESPDLSRLTDDIGDQPRNAIVALVGHSPWMEELASMLLGGSNADLRIDFPKSGVLAMDLES